ncbi:MFS general substrate transporter [Myriangium duriaei CBS 260.36]|uniref:MFS general substrate transporter n=1 Tax=Myriangium duriaei CBS 260.36 TaxID=1168546 RepID=A0A9P4J0T6_9PEZI|nr:MFS general substrate transporter [Myriangium duriaei CBS 260.36]
MSSQISSHSNGSATCVITAPGTAHHKPTAPQDRSATTSSYSSARPLGTNAIPLTPMNNHVTSSSPHLEADDNWPPPVDAVDDESNLEQWNHPRINLFRTSAAFWALFLTGVNDGTYGAMIPYLESYYNLSYLLVSLIFLSPAVGYILSAALNNTIHLRYGQRGIAILSPACHVISYIIISFHPPFPVLVLTYLLVGIGNGLADSAWNAWIGAMRDPNQVLGFLHAFYGAGATIAPLCATALIVQGHAHWFQWYYVMLGGALFEAFSCVWAFWRYDGAAYRATHETASSPLPATTPATPSKKKSLMITALTTAPHARVIWLAALFLLGYVGVEVCLGGWIVEFMRRERSGQALASSIAATGFWLGITIGRLVLGFVTPRLGEKLSITIYLPCAFALQLVFWLVPSFTVSAVAVALQGFFLGPMFPAAIVACTKLLPKRLHVAGIGFAAAFGGSGGAILPFATGVLAQAKGVQVLQPIVLALLVTTWLLWLGLPRIERKRE